MEAFATLPCCFEKSGRANNTVHEICLSFAAVVLLLLRPSAVGLRDSELGIFTRKTKDAAACLAMLARNPETMKLTFPRFLQRQFLSKFARNTLDPRTIESTIAKSEFHSNKFFRPFDGAEKVQFAPFSR